MDNTIKNTAIYEGIDVSKWQKVIDWDAVKRSKKVDFAYIRAGFGSRQKDDYFEDNYKKATEAGIHVGAYLFAYAQTPEQARAEAYHFLDLLDGKQFDFPVVYDVENSYNREGKPITNYNALGKIQTSAIVDAFCHIMEEHGYYAQIYVGRSLGDNYLSEDIHNKYDIWSADWNDKPTSRYPFGVWQYASDGKVDGIKGNVDMNLSFRDYPEIIKNKGLNNYTSTTENDADNNVDVEIDNAEPEQSTIYIVSQGDTLAAIASKYGRTVEELARVNRIKNPDLIYPNQKIYIPSKDSDLKTTLNPGDKLKIKIGAIDLNMHTKIAKWACERIYTIKDSSDIFPNREGGAVRLRSYDSKKSFGVVKLSDIYKVE